jgi:Family of unknown function (DUF5764)
MDDFSIATLHESKNEWCARLLNILTPLIIEGFKSIFDESFRLCKQNNETEKYLMTFQNFITRIPKWNPVVIENERKRIADKSHCNYLEDLVVCTHIIQLKLLTAMRVGNKQKKIDINIPKLDDFIHKVYVNSARKIYKNVYLFEINIPALQVQKHNRELELIVQECILNTIRDSIPVESILRAYMDETIEEDVVEEVKEQIIKEEKPKETMVIGGVSEPSETGIKFNDTDFVKDQNGGEVLVSAPKDIERLEEISNLRNIQRKLEEAEEEDNDDEKLNISNEEVPLNGLDINDITSGGEAPMSLNVDDLLGDIEILT